VGVDGSGALLVDTGEDVRVISAGDVVHLRTNRAEPAESTELEEPLELARRDHDTSDGREEEEG
jgi:hypothetical protein